MLGRACCTNWQDTFIQTNMDVIARWVRVITLAKGRHFLNLLVLHRFRVSSKSYKLAPRIGTRVQCLSNDPSVAFSHSFTSSSASHVVAYEIRQAGYPLCSVVVSDYFPSKITIKKPGPVWKDVLSFGPLLQCYMATFPPSSGGSQFCRQRVTGRSGLFWPAFWIFLKGWKANASSHEGLGTILLALLMDEIPHQERNAQWGFPSPIDK